MYFVAIILYSALQCICNSLLCTTVLLKSCTLPKNILIALCSSLDYSAEQSSAISSSTSQLFSRVNMTHITASIPRTNWRCLIHIFKSWHKDFPKNSLNWVNCSERPQKKLKKTLINNNRSIVPKWANLAWTIRGQFVDKYLSPWDCPHSRLLK